MEALIESIATSLNTTFNEKLVGSGGDFGAGLTHGPYTVTCYFDQWEDIVYPNIAMQVVQDIHVGPPLECCGGGVMELTLNFRISIDSKENEYSIGSALVEAVRTWLCSISESDEITAVGYTYVAIVTVPDTLWVYDGPILNLNVVTKVSYIRQIANVEE